MNTPDLFTRARSRIAPVALMLSDEDMAIECHIDFARPRKTFLEFFRTTDAAVIVEGLTIVIEEMK